MAPYPQLKVLLEVIDGRSGGLQSHSGEESNANALTTFESTMSSMYPDATSIYV
jgi:hypothetical protein